MQNLTPTTTLVSNLYLGEKNTKINKKTIMKLKSMWGINFKDIIINVKWHLYPSYISKFQGSNGPWASGVHGTVSVGYCSKLVLVLRFWKSEPNRVENNFSSGSKLAVPQFFFIF